jgi:hypothetical protein
MNFETFLIELTGRLLAQNERKTILQGMEPKVVIVREELGIEIPVKRVEDGVGTIRVII